MTPQQIVGLGIRLFAVWLAISSVRYLSSVPIYIASTGDIAEKVYQAYIVAAAYLGAALLLWFFPLTTAHKLIPRIHLNNKLKLNVMSVAQVGCALLGLWLLTKSLPGLIGNFLSLYIHQSSISDMATYSQVEFGVYAFEVVFALFLVLKSRVFAALVLRGTNDKDD